MTKDLEQRLNNHLHIPALPPQQEQAPLYQEIHSQTVHEYTEEPPETNDDVLLPRGSENVDLSIDLSIDLNVSFDLSFELF
jgi:hypothetical protein